MIFPKLSAGGVYVGAQLAAYGALDAEALELLLKLDRF